MLDCILYETGMEVLASDMIVEIASYLNRPAYAAIILRNWDGEAIATLESRVNNGEFILSYHRSMKEWCIRDRKQLFDNLRDKAPAFFEIRSIVAVQTDGKEKTLYVSDSCEGILSVGVCSWIMWSMMS